jgi:penicillin-binding protein 1A
VQLPQWQLEPDDEYIQGNPEDYYNYDENGNLVPPPGPDLPRGNLLPPDGATEPERRQQPEGQANPGAAPPAASEDFLNRATGRGDSSNPPRVRRIGPTTAPNASPTSLPRVVQPPSQP